MYSYKEAVNYIEKIPKFIKGHTFADTKKLMKRLGNPGGTRKVIHVAGTNGKGSVCAFMQAILLKEGKQTGMFTSPHLLKFNERMRLNGSEVSDSEFVEVFEKVKSTVDEMEKEGIVHPSYFDFLYAMAMTLFEKDQMEYIILETGLGGRFDATNTFETPIVSVITSIGMDHMAILGDTIEKIAGEKAGIIKEKIPVFFDGCKEESAAVLEDRAKKMHAPYRKISPKTYEIREITDKRIAFSFLNEYDNNTVWQVKGTGLYQVQNAALAIEVMKYILDASDEQKKERMAGWKKAVAEVTWKGRMEEVMPGVIFDGAHNLDAIEIFVKSLEAQDWLYLKKGEERPKNTILFSAVSDKDYDSMIKVLCSCDHIDRYIITKIDDKRGTGEEKLADLFRKYSDKPVIEVKSSKEAFKEAMDAKGEKGRLYCLGSLYLVGELMGHTGGNYA